MSATFWVEMAGNAMAVVAVVLAMRHSIVRMFLALAASQILISASEIMLGGPWVWAAYVFLLAAGWSLACAYFQRVYVTISRLQGALDQAIDLLMRVMDLPAEPDENHGRG